MTLGYSQLKGYIERRRPGGNQEEALRDLRARNRARPAQQPLATADRP